MGDDTIAAVATGAGPAGLAVVRVSGRASREVARRLGLPELEARRATYAAILHPDDGRLVDRGVVVRYVAPASYTGEDALEIGCHGGALAPQQVLDAVCAAGARPAAPGEFTRRAFLNGKMDLVQAEATADLVEARSEALHLAALVQLEGGLSRRIEALREAFLELQALLAYEVDFPEEDEGPVPPERIDARAEELADAIAGLLRHAPEGELLREGALTVVAGRPNAGKSSIFNSLLGEERAIVTEVPGTTRDAIEALASLDGFPFRLVDTAGLREATDRVEGLGIEVARRYLRHADVVLFCAEADRELGDEERRFVEAHRAARPVVVARTKADLLPDGEARAGTAPGEVAVSAAEARGLDRLREALLEAAYAGIRGAGEAPLVTRRRQARTLRRAGDEVEGFLGARRAGLPAEVASVHLQEARRALEELLGAVDVEDVLDAVFGRFCVGK